MPDEISRTVYEAIILTSREIEYAVRDAAKEQRVIEQAVMDELTQHQAQGIGLAGFCHAFWDAMMDGEEMEQRFSRDEILDLLQAAVTGKG